MLPDREQETSLSLFTIVGNVNPVNISKRFFSDGGEDDDLKTSLMSIFEDDSYWNHIKYEDAVVEMQELSLLQFLHRSRNEIVVSLHSIVSTPNGYKCDLTKTCNSLLSLPPHHIWNVT